MFPTGDIILPTTQCAQNQYILSQGKYFGGNAIQFIIKHFDMDTFIIPGLVITNVCNISTVVKTKDVCSFFFIF